MPRNMWRPEDRMSGIEPHRIAFCITELDRGGAERALIQLVLGLDRTRWQPRVYCLGPPGEYAEVLTRENVPVVCYGARGLASLPRVLWRLWRDFRRFQPVLLQTFLFHANLVGRIAAWLAGIPIVVSGIRVAERRTKWHGRLDRWTTGFVTQTVCVSAGVAEFSIHETRLSPARLSVIPNGVDLESFAQAPSADLSPWGIATGSPVVLTVARLEPQKGIGDLLQAVPAILELVPECQFLIVGEGPDRARLEAQARALGIASSVHFAGLRTDVPGLLKAATLFVLPSHWEGMPNALLEAMASPLPVVATDVEGSREVVLHEHNGLRIRPGKPAEISAALLRLLQDHTLARRLAAEAQQTVSKRFTTQSMVASYDQLYGSLLKKA